MKTASRDCWLSPKEGLCPPFDACLNTNLFQHLFGIKFAYENHLHVQGILPFKFAHCFGFTDDLAYRLSQPKNKFCLDGAIPGRTSSWLFKQIHAHLIFLRNSNCKIMMPKQYAALAATIQAFVNGDIGSRLPSHSHWIKAHSDNPKCSTLCHLAENPGAIFKEALKNVHYCYRQPLRQYQIVIEDNMLIYHETIRRSCSYLAEDCSQSSFWHSLCGFSFQPHRWSFQCLLHPTLSASSLLLA
jgi:hypothetical protein